MTVTPDPVERADRRDLIAPKQGGNGGLARHNHESFNRMNRSWREGSAGVSRCLKTELCANGRGEKPILLSNREKVLLPGSIRRAFDRLEVCARGAFVHEGQGRLNLELPRPADTNLA